MRTIILSLVLAAPAAAAEPVTRLETGVAWQKGRYGTEASVEVVSAPVALRHRRGRVSVAASVPWQRIEGPGNLVGGGGPLGLPILVDPARPGTRSIRQGLGDARITAAYTIPRERLGGVAVAAIGQVKLPTASRSRGLGTGKADYTAAVELAGRIGPVAPFAAAGYTIVGEPAGLDLRNAASARAGASLDQSPRAQATLSFDYAGSISPLLPDERQLSTGFETAVSKRLSLRLHGSAGLSDGAPDAAAGIGIGLKL
jgi:hypothetical protein